MKKLLMITFLVVFCAGAINAEVLSDSWKIKEAVKKDTQATTTSLKKAIKTDIKDKTKEEASVPAAKKAEKMAEIDKKLKELNAELKRVKNDKTMTETERALKIKGIQHKIDIYAKQKAALSK